ncbi:MAG: LacI family DNA-binding transcriptional regulator [Bryobacteraceae bacterium]|jgi:DNA-binding LacI/PurR family transcriptional regulator
MISIKDIARAARVSHSTVSRALRNSTLVNAKTRELVQKIAAQQGYSVSAAARSLVTGRTNTIGVVVTSISNPFVGEIVAGVEEFALAHGYSILLSTSHADPAREMRAVRSLHEHRVDGILVNSSRVGRLYMPLLEEMKVPIVLINNEHPGEFIHSVTIDNLRAGRDATRHLVQLGHNRIGYVGNQFGLQADTERFSGYRQVLEEADIGFAPELVAHGDGGPEAGMRATARLLALPEAPTAVFCFNDMQALGALRAARERGLNVPGDLSVVGLDDLYLSSYTDPPLTTIQQPKHEMGRLAAQILLEQLSGKHPESRMTLAGKLVVRQSTAPPRDVKGR